MIAYIIRRTGTSIVVLLGVSVFIFFLLHKIYPSPAIDVLGPRASPPAIARWNLDHGFVGRMDAALRARERRELDGLLADMPARRLAGALTGVIADAISGTAARWRAAADRRIAATWQAAGRPAAGWPALPFPAGREPVFTIGRDGGCDLVLADLSVSRRHARLERDGNGWLLTDLRSTNGTRLNGWLVSSPVPVRAGDQVSFGAVSFVLADG